MRNILILTALAASAALLVSCGEGQLRLDVTPSVMIHYFERPDSQEMTVDAGAYFDMEFTWKVGADFVPPKNENLRAFVHFRDSVGNMISDPDGNTLRIRDVTGKMLAVTLGKTLQMDHDFEIPLTQWEAGKDIVYTFKRLKFDENLGNMNLLVNMYVGIYDPETSSRAELSVGGEPPENHAYKMATFRIRKNPKIYPRYNETWHGPEPAPHERRRWSDRVSEVTFLRDDLAPGAEIWLAGHSPIEDIADQTEQKFWIYMHEKRPELLITKEPIILTKERFELTRIPIPKEIWQTYTDRDIKLIFELDPVFVTDATDARRELGFLVYELLLQPKNLEW